MFTFITIIVLIVIEARFLVRFVQHFIEKEFILGAITTIQFLLTLHLIRLVIYK